MWKKMKRREKIVLIVAFFVLSGFLFYTLYYQPAQIKRKDLLSETDQFQQEYNNKISLVRSKLPRFKKEVADLEEQLAEALQQFSREKDYQNFLVDITDLAAKQDITLETFTPLHMNQRDGFNEVPITISFRTNYLGLLEFLYSLGQYPKVINIRSIQMKLAPGLEKDLIVDMVLMVYMIDE